VFSITVVLVGELHFKLYMGLSQIDMNHVFKLADETLISFCKNQSVIVPP
jgi:hypothetical protein